MEYFRATSALPFVSRPVEINGKQYLDDGISDSIPLEQCRRLGYDKIIVVLTHPQTYRKSLISHWLPKLFYRRYPHLLATLIDRHTAYNQTEEKIETPERKLQIFVIRP